MEPHLNGGTTAANDRSHPTIQVSSTFVSDPQVDGSINAAYPHEAEFYDDGGVESTQLNFHTQQSQLHYQQQQYHSIDSSIQATSSPDCLQIACDQAFNDHTSDPTAFNLEYLGPCGNYWQPVPPPTVVVVQENSCATVVSNDDYAHNEQPSISHINQLDSVAVCQQDGKFGISLVLGFLFLCERLFSGKVNTFNFSNLKFSRD